MLPRARNGGKIVKTVTVDVPACPQWRQNCKNGNGGCSRVPAMAAKS
ncbi:hypothetical protein [Cerasibacillus terrae]|nr:hypothetical protein [Cerasibacillus terrae]